MLNRFIKFSNWLDGHWIGDVIGCASLFGLMFIGLIFVGVFQ